MSFRGGGVQPEEGWRGKKEKEETYLAAEVEALDHLALERVEAHLLERHPAARHELVAVLPAAAHRVAPAQELGHQLVDVVFGCFFPLVVRGDPCTCVGGRGKGQGSDRGRECVNEWGGGTGEMAYRRGRGGSTTGAERGYPAQPRPPPWCPRCCPPRPRPPCRNPSPPRTCTTRRRRCHRRRKSSRPGRRESLCRSNGWGAARVHARGGRTRARRPRPAASRRLPRSGTPKPPRRGPRRR